MEKEKPSRLKAGNNARDTKTGSGQQRQPRRPWVVLRRRPPRPPVRPASSMCTTWFRNARQHFNRFRVRSRKATRNTCGALPRGRYQRRLVWLHIPASRRYSNSRRDRGSPARGKGQPDARENCTVRARCSATATSAWDSSRNVVCAGRLPARARQPDIAAGAGRPAKELVAVGRLRTDEGWFSFDYIFPDGYTYRCPFKSRCGAGGQGRQAWWLSGCTPVPWCAQSSPTPPVTATTPCPAALTSTRTASTSASWSARRGVLAATHLQGAPAGWQQMLGSPRGGGKRNAAACPYLLDLRPSLWRASCCARLGCSFP